MKKSRVNFNFLDKEDHVPAGSKEITCHLIFDVKMDLTRKDRYVSRSHLVYHIAYMTHARMVSCDSVSLTFLVAALNDLDVLSGDIQK